MPEPLSTADATGDRAADPQVAAAGGPGDEAARLRAEVARLQAEVARLRADDERRRAEHATLGEEVLRLRDAVVGRDAELGTARGRLAELEGLVTRYEHAAHRLDDVLGSTSWKLMWAAGAPVRKVRERSKGD